MTNQMNPRQDCRRLLLLLNDRLDYSDVWGAGSCFVKIYFITDVVGPGSCAVWPTSRCGQVPRKTLRSPRTGEGLDNPTLNRHTLAPQHALNPFKAIEQ